MLGPTHCTVEQFLAALQSLILSVIQPALKSIHLSLWSFGNGITFPFSSFFSGSFIISASLARPYRIERMAMHLRSSRPRQLYCMQLSCSLQYLPHASKVSILASGGATQPSQSPLSQSSRISGSPGCWNCQRSAYVRGRCAWVSH